MSLNDSFKGYLPATAFIMSKKRAADAAEPLMTQPAQVLGSKENLQNLRTQVHALQDGTRVIPTFHPLELLSTPALKKDAWEDLKLAMKHKKVPGTFL